MMKYAMLLTVAAMMAAIFVLAEVAGKVSDTAHAEAGTPSNVSATNGANPGEAVISWASVAGASEYRVGWLAVRVIAQLWPAGIAPLESSMTTAADPQIVPRPPLHRR